jgi:plastocyanin domain-containing protein
MSGQNSTSPAVKFSMRSKSKIYVSINGSLTMKNSAIFFLFCIGVAGYAASRADTSVHEEIVYQATIAADGVQHVRIEGGTDFYKPNHVIVKVNVPVEFTASVEKGWIPHTLVIQSPEAGMSVDEKLSSDPINIRFTPTVVGKYHFYCKNKLLFFKSHREKGMEGVLEVIQ